MMNISILQYTVEHRDKLKALFLTTRRQTFHWLDPLAFQPDDFDQATEGETLLVALHGHQPVGFISWWPPDHFIHHLFVDPHFQKQGIGGALLQACLATIGRPAKLKCLIANQNAMDFYLHHHWYIDGKGESGDGEYALLRLDD